MWPLCSVFRICHVSNVNARVWACVCVFILVFRINKIETALCLFSLFYGLLRQWLTKTKQKNIRKLKWSAREGWREISFRIGRGLSLGGDSGCDAIAISIILKISSISPPSFELIAEARRSAAKQSDTSYENFVIKPIIHYTYTQRDAVIFYLMAHIKLLNFSVVLFNFVLAEFARARDFVLSHAPTYNNWTLTWPLTPCTSLALSLSRSHSFLYYCCAEHSNRHENLPLN